MDYIAVWDGYSSGSYLGRDDGYPEKRLKIIKDLGDVRNVINQSGVKFFKLESANAEEMMQSLPADPLGIFKIDT